MTPVRLRLQNFLSYGTEAPELDFEQFDVAVLSGGNGQGKSALLDAITWALWGEARQAAGAGKPDEELLHSGANRMEVEFEFSQEGTRYRVARSYTRSATGRTTRPGLDFFVYEPASEQWNALTAESMRATQVEIEKRVGVDYDTFINSALLLQGRSDEFTRRRPAERKEVLGRILGLERYQRLAEAAGARFSRAREAARRSEEHVARLREALSREREWKKAASEAEAEAVAAQWERDQLAAQEAALAAKAAALEEQEAEAGRRREELRRLEERGARIAAELERTRVRMEDAEATLARRSEIEAAKTRFDELTVRRASLEDQAAVYRKLTADLTSARREADDLASGLDSRLARARAEEAAVVSDLAGMNARLLTRQATESALAVAGNAAAIAEDLAKKRRRHDELRERRARAEEMIATARSDLNLEVIRAQAECDELAAIPGRLEELNEESTVLAAEVERILALHRSRDEVRTAGTERRLQHEVVRRDIERLLAEVAVVRERRSKVTTAGDGVCPTCGSQLTEEHRKKMAGAYSTEIRGLERSIARREKEATALRLSCRRLADEFRGYEDSIARANGAAGHHAHVLAEIARLESQLGEAVRKTERAEKLRERLAEGNFALDAQRECAEIDQQLERLAFDSAAYETARADAVGLSTLQAAVAELTSLAERRQCVAEHASSIAREIQALEQDIRDGVSVAPLRTRIAEIERECELVAYAPEEYERVSEDLRGLSNVLLDVARLASAEKELQALQRRLGELADEAASCRDGIEQGRAALAAVDGALHERPAILAGLADVSARRSVADSLVGEAQGRLGGLREKLARCELDRALLKEEQASLKASKRDASLNRHLKQAFGPHGIPSMIIEETLPEIEERANELLGRLSHDRTRVALETLKETRNGGSRDTLEIRITDQRGTARPYETYSGGEAFRVDFALRIALAQLLTDRAGVRLRTLVVDEGFGTQDQEGRQGLVDAIGVVQADFDKVLVISHLDEIKDAFPVRIEVSKSPLAGSTFAVVGVA